MKHVICLVAGLAIASAAYAQSPKSQSPVTTVVTDPTWRPTERQRGIVLELTRRYFRMKDTRDYEQVRQILAPALPFEDWQAAAEKFDKQAGEVRPPQGEKGKGDKKPPNRTPPGHYWAVRFTREVAKNW